MQNDFDPVARYGQNLAILSQGQIGYWRVRFMEGMPPGPASVIDFGSITGGSASTKAAQSVLQVDDNYLLHLRMKCIDDVSVRLYELGGTGRFWAKNWQARASKLTPAYDPTMRSTEFFIMGFNRDAQFEVVNPWDTTQARSRVMFWGWKYILEYLDRQPDHFTWLPADGQIAA